MSNESIKPPAASNISLSPALYHINNKLQVKFDGHCIKQDKVAFTTDGLDEDDYREGIFYIFYWAICFVRRNFV